MSTPILEQQTRNPKVLKNVNRPDTDSRYIELYTGNTSIYPDLMHDHSRMKYTVPTNNTQPITIQNPINWEDRTIHWLELDNSNNTAAKTFTFGAAHTLLDDPDNASKSYSIPAGDKMSWVGTVIEGKFSWRLSSESTV